MMPNSLTGHEVKLEIMKPGYFNVIEAACEGVKIYFDSCWLIRTMHVEYLGSISHWPTFRQC